jgi:hypothetical protein
MSMCKFNLISGRSLQKTPKMDQSLELNGITLPCPMVRVTPSHVIANPHMNLLPSS